MAWTCCGGVTREAVARFVCLCLGFDFLTSWLAITHCLLHLQHALSRWAKNESDATERQNSHRLLLVAVADRGL